MRVWFCLLQASATLSLQHNGACQNMAAWPSVSFTASHCHVLQKGHTCVWQCACMSVVVLAFVVCYAIHSLHRTLLMINIVRRFHSADRSKDILSLWAGCLSYAQGPKTSVHSCNIDAELQNGRQSRRPDAGGTRCSNPQYLQYDDIEHALPTHPVERPSGPCHAHDWKDQRIYDDSGNTQFGAWQTHQNEPGSYASV